MGIIRYVKRSSITLKIYKILFSIIGLFPVKKDLIIFESFSGKQFSCNPRAIYEYLCEKNSPHKMYWSIDKKAEITDINNSVLTVNRFSIKWLFLLPRARYWISNSRMPLWMKKHKDTIYIQTWHGTPLKKLGVDIDEVVMPGTTTDDYKENFVKETGKWDYLISPNAYSTDIFKRAFKFNKNIIETGYPRNDYLISNNNFERINLLKEKLGIPIGKKIILYAPTWRDDEYHRKGEYKFELKFDLNKFEKELKNDYIILLRMHYLVKESFDLSGYKDFIYDYSDYSDIRDLYLVSDILITDYSSVFFDYLILDRPIIFFTYDIEKYRKKTRGFYFDLEVNSPGPLVKTSNELLELLQLITRTEYTISESQLNFKSKYSYLENGSSTKKVLKKILIENQI
ncbi:CDP-glycerol glycerophosphotransferase family protein [Bacillus sp. LL01]|uniref:CDP-glycerol glycerophosphotransferase family protein n=1 Tax=Bacillus sp. LL01 TaxID=1665556 RepID=UPI000AC4EA34|nr:CDP-glycerol glycerophosphotransferase family protein [Bacillus sp. LL01]